MHTQPNLLRTLGALAAAIIITGVVAPATGATTLRCPARDQSLTVAGTATQTRTHAFGGAASTRVEGPGQAAACPRVSKSRRASARPRVRTSPGPCSRDDREPLAREPASGNLQRVMVPAGADEVTVCSYNGGNVEGHTPQFALTAWGQTRSGATISQITRALDAIKRPASYEISCPLDNGAQALVRFTYASGAKVVLTVELGGCGVISNGRISRMPVTGTARARVMALAKPVSLSFGTVTGVLEACGRAAGQISSATCVPDDRASCPACQTGYAVEVVNASNQWVAEGSVGRLHGRFSMRVVTPGSYRLELFAPGGANRLIEFTRVTVSLGRRTNANLKLPSGRAATAAAPHCPASSRGVSMPSNPRPTASRVLAPGNANRLLVCRFQPALDGSTTGGYGLIEQGQTTSHTLIATITRELDAIKSNHRLVCPLDLIAGTETVTLLYTHGPSVRLTVELGGCETISNGHLARPGLGSPALQQINGLLKPVGSRSQTP
ncbi:MAG: carboxypeptidase-like regulatory domain-containing protein [Solirubrobacteraceae bacterium]